MTTDIIFATNKVDVTDRQLQAVLDRFELGRLISSDRPSSGVMGQTLFVTSTAGEFVLKGNPYFEGQFVEEKFFVDNLERRTGLPVPSPYLVDNASDIFGWSYALMPRLPGVDYDEVEDGLSTDERMQLATTLGETLAQMHRWQVDAFGEFDAKVGVIRPFEASYKTWLYDRIRYWLNDAHKYSTITPMDETWVDELLQSAAPAFDTPCRATFVMGDFKPGNFLLQPGASGWEVSALFDFTTAYFGDPLADLPRLTLQYFEAGQESLAEAFVTSYLRNSADVEDVEKRLQVHLLHQRVLDWGCAWAIDAVSWDHGLSFSAWAKQYIAAVLNVIR